MSYGAISGNRNEVEDEVQLRRPREPNSKNTLKVLGIVLTVTLVGCVAAAIIGAPSGQTKGQLLATQSTTAPRGRRQPTVTITQGKLKGVILQSRAGRNYYGFYNVPYGKPPVGNLRFMPPEPADGWNGTLDATQKGSKCIQQAKTNQSITEGDEDCLHVNIYTPKIPGTYRKPSLSVLVYFFGGGFMHGTANDFSASYFMDEEVVIVIVEARVGALGFLNTGDLEATGNQGLKDQNLALKWVQANIQRFGGDPNRVVAFGTSSGAMCAHSHLLSPMSEGLFSGVMSISGVIISPGVFSTNPRKSAETLGEALGCPDLKNSKSLLECLRSATPDEIAQNQPTFGPSVEAIPENGDLSNVFFPDNPFNLLRSGRVNKVPWITGTNSAEDIRKSYTLLLDPEAVTNINDEWDATIRTTLALGDDPASMKISHELREFYFGNKSVGVDTRYNLTNMLSDRFYIHSAKTAAVLQAQQGPVYTYYLTKEANVSWAADVIQYFDPPYGVSHADEVQYFFVRPGYPFIPLDSPHGNFSVMIVKLWVSFAETGAPVGPNEEWPAIGKDWSGLTWYNLDDEPKLVQPFTERMELWNSFEIDLLYNQNQTTS